MMDTFFSPVSDGKLYCRKYGQGLPIILIHGACVDSDFFHDTAQILARQFSVYTAALFTHGGLLSGTRMLLWLGESVTNLVLPVVTVTAYSTVVAFFAARRHARGPRAFGLPKR